jgi:hypothetical protein
MLSERMAVVAATVASVAPVLAAGMMLFIGKRRPFWPELAPLR